MQWYSSANNFLKVSVYIGRILLGKIGPVAQGYRQNAPFLGASLRACKMKKREEKKEKEKEEKKTLKGHN